MIKLNYKNMDERPIVLHQGVYKRVTSMPGAIFMITGMTIGAGVLGLPYVVAQVGLKVGLAYILILGLVMMSLNLMIGEIAVRTNEKLQLPGFAGKYLGPWAKSIMSLVVITSGLGVLLAYIIGEGQTIGALLGIDPRYCSIAFWALGGLLVWRGLQTVKVAEKIFSLLVMAIIAGLSIHFLPDFQIANWEFFDVSKIFLPFGVVLFSLHASPAVVEAHTLMPGSQKHYRYAVIIGTLVPTILYMLFVAAVVGVSGLDTTQIATIGLGKIYGGWVMIVGNLFAILAMGTAFMGMGVALKQMLVWDHKVNHWLANLLVVFLPLFLFILGLNNFTAILDVVGGLFIGIEAVLMVMACYIAKRKGDLGASRYGLHYFWLAAIPVLIIFSLSTIVSVINIVR
ncbi:MAG: aromatic amino acid transport family protein [Candidatus Magasanikbacteria bacterium]